MSETNKWFNNNKSSEPEKSPKKKNVRSVPTTNLLRIVEEPVVYEPGYLKNNLYASNIGDPDWDLTAELVNFWKPETPQPISLKKQLYCEQSNVKHAAWQRRYFEAGLLHPLHNNKGKFKEVRCYFDEYGISGKIDLIFPNAEYIKARGAKTPPKKLPKIEDWMAVDIKETDERRFNEIEPDFVSDKYLTQVSLYIKWLYDQGLSKKKVGGFYYLNRNNPWTAKLFEVTIREDLLDKAFAKANEFWDWVKHRQLPSTKEYSKTWIEDQIALQPDREWNKLSGLTKITQKELF